MKTPRRSPEQKVSKLELHREMQWRLWQGSALDFIQDNLHVNVVGQGYRHEPLYPFQPKIVETMDEISADQGRHVFLKARQIGATTITSAYALWSILFHEDRPWLITSIGEAEAVETLSTKVAQAYNALPAWVRKRGPKLVRDTYEVFGFDNGSSITAIPSTSKAGRSRAVYGVIMDEAGFQEYADELFGALDPMCYGPMIVLSTANGMGNWFHQIYQDAHHPDSAWSHSFYPWTEVPGRSDEWYEEMRKRYRSQPRLFAQEYPASPLEAFLKSGNTVYDLEVLRDEHDWGAPAFRYDLSMFQATDPSYSLIPVDEAGERALELHVWQKPWIDRDEYGRVRKLPNYVVGSDVAEGIDGRDFSTMTVIDSETLEIVATVKAHIPIHDLGRYLFEVASWYHTALLGPERNAVGITPLVYLQDNGYPRLYRMEKVAEIKIGGRTVRYGFVTSHVSKPKAVHHLAKLLSDGECLLHDQRLYDEFTTYVSNKRGRFGAAPSNHDDLVSATIIAYQLAADVGRFPQIWFDDRTHPTTFDDVFGDNEDRHDGLALAASIGDGSMTKGGDAVQSFMIVQGG